MRVGVQEEEEEEDKEYRKTAFNAKLPSFGTDSRTVLKWEEVAYSDESAQEEFIFLGAITSENIINKNDLLQSQDKSNSTLLPKKDPQPSTSQGIETGRAEVKTKPEVSKKVCSSSTKGNSSSKRNSKGISETSSKKKEIVSTVAAPVPESPKKKGKKSKKVYVTRSQSPDIRVDSVVSLATEKESSPEKEVKIIEEEKETTSTSALNEDRIPTLALVVTITSPKRVEKQKEEEVKDVTPTQEQDDDENVECILPHEIVDEDRWSFNSVTTEKMEEEGEASQLLLASDNDDSVGSVFLTPDNIQELPNGFVGVNTVVYKLCISGDVQPDMEEDRERQIKPVDTFNVAVDQSGKE
ncbi:unnamed protein product [Orchesella dallaii]|uniref:Uncharacterized protein n=1 Tax=Orchesella dallaii TaxID=48710 RepID=A0ABP1RPV5_9HEXA